MEMFKIFSYGVCKYRNVKSKLIMLGVNLSLICLRFWKIVPRKVMSVKKKKKKKTKLQKRPQSAKGEECNQKRVRKRILKNLDVIETIKVKEFLKVEEKLFIGVEPLSKHLML